MSRRFYRVFYLLLVVVSLPLVARPIAAQESTESGRPNILYLMADDQRYDTLGCMGHPIIHTPNIDALAARGVVFDRMFVTTAICMTNRTNILLGQYAARHGNWDFGYSLSAEQQARCYPALLKKAGYYVGYIGKWGVGRPPKDLFDYNRAWPGQNKYEHQIDGKPIHLTRLMGNQALEFLDGVPSDRPFCLSLCFKAPHVQDEDPRQFIPDPALNYLYQDVTIPPPVLGEPEFFESQPEFLQKSLNRVRWEKRFATPEMYQTMVKNHHRLVSGIDVQVGRILEKLEKKGLDGNTVIIYTADNGFYLGERGLAGKWLAHDLSIRVPLIVVDPRLPEPRRGTRCDAMALSLDLAPTMLELAGVEIPEVMQGRSLTPLLRGEQVPWRDEFFYEHHFAPQMIPASEAVRNDRWKYIRYFNDPDHPFEELYDLRADPIEQYNLAADPAHAATLATMREKWARWREGVR